MDNDYIQALKEVENEIDYLLLEVSRGYQSFETFPAYRINNNPSIEAKNEYKSNC